jgi:hypothetical protein
MAETMGVDLQYVEVSCQRSVGDSVGSPSNFSAGVQDYTWGIGKGMVWYPSRSYFRFTVQLKGSGRYSAIPNKPLISEQLALAENFMANCYQSLYFLAGGQAVSSITNFLPQCSQVDNRVSSSAAWLKSMGESAHYTNPHFSSRVNAVSTQGVYPNSDAYVAGNGDLNIMEGRGFSGLSLHEGKSQYSKPLLTGYTFATATLTYNGADSSSWLGTGIKLTPNDVGSTIVIAGNFYQISFVGNVTANNTQPFFVHEFRTSPPANFRTTDWYLIQRNINRSSESHSYLQALWRPSCVGIFNHAGAIASGDFRLQLSPDSNYKIAACQSVVPGYSGHEFMVTDVKFYVATSKLMIPDSIQTLYLDEYMAQSKVMTTNDQNLSFTVPASTKTLYVFLQSGRAGQSIEFPPSLFKAENDADLNLTKLQITYGNISRPQTILSSGYTNSIDSSAYNPPVPSTAVSQNLLMQLYLQSALETDQATREGGCESFNDWVQSPLYAFTWSKPEGDLSTNVQLQITYSDPTSNGVSSFPTNSKVFLVAKYSRTAEITTANGMVTAVRTLNV